MNHSDDHWRFTGENPPPELIERIPNWNLHSTRRMWKAKMRARSSPKGNNG